LKDIIFDAWGSITGSIDFIL